MPIEHVETLIVGGGQAGLALSHMLGQRGCRHLVLERGRIAERWRTRALGRPALPVPQLVGTASRFPLSPRRPRRLRHERRDRRLPHRLCRVHRRAGPLRRRRDGPAPSRGRIRLRRRDLGRPDRGGQCRRRHRPLSARHHPGLAARGCRSLSGPCQPLSRTGPASGRRRAGRGLRRFRRPDRRGARFAPAAASISRSAATAGCRAAIAATISPGGSAPWGSTRLRWRSADRTGRCR